MVRKTALSKILTVNVYGVDCISDVNSVSVGSKFVSIDTVSLNFAAINIKLKSLREPG